jgi:hypothetical protein
MVVTWYLTYKNKLNNIKVASSSSQNHLQLKRGWYKDAKSWLNHWGIKEEVTLQKYNNVKNIITSKLKKKLWCDKELEDERKLRYYKEVSNSNL